MAYRNRRAPRNACSSCHTFRPPPHSLQVADEHGLEVSLNLPQASEAPVPGQKVAAPESDLTQRLAELRGK